MPVFPKNPSPKDILNAYNEGFVGSIRNPNKLDKLLGDLPHPLFGAASTFKKGNRIYTLDGSGDKVLALLYLSVRKFDKTLFEDEAQQTGDCLFENTLVRMADGTDKAIQDVQIGDEVISHLGNRRKVTALIKKPYNGNMVTINVEGYAKPISATPDHKFTKFIELDGTSYDTEQYPIGSLEIGQHILLPRRPEITQYLSYDLASLSSNLLTNKSSEGQRTKRVSEGFVRDKNSAKETIRNLVLDEEIGWVIGTLLGDGTIEPLRIMLNLGLKDTLVAEQFKDILQRKFGAETRIYSVPSKPTVLYARCNNPVVARFFKSLIQGNTYTKKVPQEIFNSPKGVKLACLRGWMDTDGCLHNKKRANGENHVLKLTGVSVCSDLVEGMFSLANDCGLRATITRRKPRKQSKAASDLHLYGANAIGVYPDVKTKVNFIKTDKRITPLGLAAKIKKIGTIPFNGYVYCIEVEKDHTFIADGYAVSNCVSHAVRNSCDTTRAVEIDIVGDLEDWITRSATEMIYKCRGHNGQGMSCSEAVEFVNRTGGVLLRKDYPELGIDLSKYNYKLGVNGRQGVSNVILAEAKKHQVKTVSLITSVEEACDAIANGYGVLCCSGQGFSSKRDSEGFAKPQGSWSHAMAWTAADTEYTKRPGILIQNSWGKWNIGPKRHNQPEGSFWADLEVCEKMIKNRGCWAVSNFDGFPAQKLPRYFDYDIFL